MRRSSLFVVVTAISCAGSPKPAPQPAADPPVVASAAPSADAPPPPAPASSKVVVTASNPPGISFLTFPSGSAKLDPSSTTTLDEAAKVFAGHPEIELVQVEGHSVAGEPPTISQARADAIKAALIARGVAANRVRAKGFLAHCPREPGNDAANRRVELKAAKKSGLAMPNLGCEAATAAGVVSDPVP